MKFIAILLLGLLAQQAQSTIAATCAKNPLIPVITDMIDQQKTLKGNNQKFDKLAAFKTATPAVATLTKCVQFTGKKTCCTEAFVGQINRLTKGFFRKHMLKKPMLHKQLKNVRKAVKACGGDVEAAKVESKAEIKTIAKDMRKCQKKATLAETNLLRGTLCNICVNPDNYDAIFTGVDAANLNTESLVMKVKSLDTYETDVAAANACTDTAQAKVKAIIDAQLTALGDKCKAKKTEIDAITGKKLATEKNCKGKAKFGGKSDCTAAQNDDTPPAARLLAAAASNFAIDAAGLDGYLVDSTENTALDAEADPLDTTQQPIIPTPEASASVLQYSAFLMLALLCFL